MLCVGTLETGHEAGDGDRALADVKDLGRGVAEVDHDLFHRGRSPRGDCEEAVEEHRLGAGAAHEQETTARRPRERAFGDETGQRSRDDRIDRVPALDERPGTCLARVWIPGCDGALHGQSLETSPRSWASAATAFHHCSYPQSREEAQGPVPGCRIPVCGLDT